MQVPAPIGRVVAPVSHHTGSTSVAYRVEDAALLRWFLTGQWSKVNRIVGYRTTIQRCRKPRHARKGVHSGLHTQSCRINVGWDGHVKFGFDGLTGIPDKSRIL